MRQDDEDYSRKSAAYRKRHMDAVKGLYGSEPYIPPKAYIKRKVKRRTDPLGESAIQIKLVTWAKKLNLDLISIPNHGKRSYWTGQKEVAMGLTKGVSDLFLAHPSDGYGGFWIELKRPGQKPTTEQYAWLVKMVERGYAAKSFDNFEIARDAIIEYLGLNGQGM